MQWDGLGLVTTIIISSVRYYITVTEINTLIMLHNYVIATAPSQALNTTAATSAPSKLDCSYFLHISL